MRTSLIVLGVLLLAIGGIFYFIPSPTASATTTSIAPGSTDTRVSSASVSLPIGITIAIAIVGFVFTLLGLTLPSADDAPQPVESTSSYAVETRVDTTSKNGRKQHTTRKRRVQRKQTN